MYPEKIMQLFVEIHGDIDDKRDSCYTAIVYDEYDGSNAIAVNVMKDGNLCWTATKQDLMFDYIMNHLEAKIVKEEI